MTKTPRWRKIKKTDAAETEALLKTHERWCLNACCRYLKRDPAKDNVWVQRENGLNAVIIHANQSLLPVFAQKEIPAPHFLRGFFNTTPVYSVQGRKEDTLILETALEKYGLYASENIDYDNMCIDRPPAGFDSSGPAGLILRKPQKSDLDDLAELHAAYEREEVLPAKSRFNKAVSRMNTVRILRDERVLVAELDGRMVGKINTNATGFTRSQIGGVYVHPDYRGRGIARRMTGEFTVSLFSEGGVSLFVKKKNSAARNVYLSIGFEISGDYRISYY